MILVQMRRSLRFLPSIYVITLTFTSYAAPTKIQVPCPSGSTHFQFPSGSNPTWLGCKDTQGLYQGWLIQTTNQGQILRLAQIKNSLRDGIEWRPGLPQTLEMRTFKNGHLEGISRIYSSEKRLQDFLPDPLEPLFFQSIGKFTLPEKPISEMQFQAGRVVSLKSADRSFSLKLDSSGRSSGTIGKDSIQWFDPEALFLLSPADAKAALVPGFGSCKKYAGPIGRYTRHLDELYFKREMKEKTHREKERLIRSRFLDFCFPGEMKTALGKLECPPALPSSVPAHTCELGISDEITLPFHPKFFTFENTFGQSPSTLREWFIKAGILKELSHPEQNEFRLELSTQYRAQIRRTPEGTFFQLYEKTPRGTWLLKKNERDPEDAWWTWHRIPGL
jgi:hypothetical protein